MRFCNECTDNLTCNNCKNRINKNKEFEANLNEIKRQTSSQYGHMLPSLNE